MKSIVATQNFFIDTTNPQAGTCQDATFILPQGLLDCAEHQEMRITLNSFSMPKNWYNINQNNSTFYIVGLEGETVTATKVVVNHGHYQYFGNVIPVLDDDPASKARIFSLADNIEYSIKVALAATHNTTVDHITCTVRYSHQSGLFHFVIDLPYNNYNDGIKLVTFTIPSRQQADPANIVSSILNTPTGSHSSRIVNAKPILSKGAMTFANNQYQFYINTPPASSTPSEGDIVEWSHTSPGAGKVTFWLKTLTIITAGPTVLVTCKNHGGALNTSDMPSGSQLTFIRDGSSDFTEAEGSTLFALNFVDVPRGTGAGTTVNTLFNFVDYEAFVNFRGQTEVAPQKTFNLLEGYTLDGISDASISVDVAGFLNFNKDVDGRPLTTSTDAPVLRTIEMDQNTAIAEGDDFSLSVTVPDAAIQVSGASRVDGVTLLATQIEYDLFDATAGTINGAVFKGQSCIAYPNLFVQDVQIRQYTAGGTTQYACTVTFTTSHGNATTNYNFASEITTGRINNIEDTHQNYWKVLVPTVLPSTVEADSIVWNNHYHFNGGSTEVTPIVDTVIPTSSLPFFTTGQTLLDSQFGNGTSVDDASRRNWFRIGGMGSVGVNDQILLRTLSTSSDNNFNQNAFQSFYEVAGGCFEGRAEVPGATASEQFRNLQKMFAHSITGAAGNKVYTGEAHYPATLQTMENLYLRTSLNSMNFQSPGFDTGAQQNIASSQVLAKIPVGNTNFAGVSQIAKTDAGDIEVVGKYMNDVPYYTIYYTDNGANNYSILLSQKRTSQLRLFLTDKYGRLLPAVSQAQINCGQLAFTASLRIDIFELGHI